MPSFGEDQGRYVVTVDAAMRPRDCSRGQAAAGVPRRVIGATGGDALNLPGDGVHIRCKS